MGRGEAAAKALTIWLTLMALAMAAARWPKTAMVALSLGSIYTKLREERHDDDRD